MSKTQSVKQQTAQKQALAKKIQNYVTETYSHDYFISLQNGYIYLYAGDNFITSAVINAISDKYSLDFIGVSIARLNTPAQNLQYQRVVICIPVLASKTLAPSIPSLGISFLHLWHLVIIGHISYDRHKSNDIVLYCRMCHNILHAYPVHIDLKEIAVPLYTKHLF